MRLFGILPALGILLLYISIPAVILYFVIKLAVKKAIKELKDENII